MASLEEVRNARLEKLKLLAAAGHEAYPIESNLTLTLADALEHFSDWEEAKKKLTLGGRVRGLRRQGALVFFDIDDGTARFQVLAKKGDLPAKEFELLSETVDIGDFVAATGTLFVTKKKEKTLLAESWQMLAKSLRPLPSEWHGLQDVEERFRRRYLDALMAPEVRERFLLRAKMVSAIRNFLEADGYVEVETPVLQPLAGGATARPFVTHHEALDIDLYLRVADELYLKRLLVAGFPKIYEIGRDFRNEGIDVTHNPEFTMLEFYAAYSTAAAQRAFVETLIKTLVKTLHKKTTITYGEAEINFAGDFQVISFNELLKKYTLINNPDELSDKELQLKVSQFGVAVEPSDSREKMLDNLYKKVCRPKLIQPTFVVDYPSNYLPLAKRLSGQSQLVDAFQLVVAGVELIKAFSELNDPQDQLARMSVQEELREKGDAEAQRLDTDFIEALEYGMPPAGGVGIGLDRLAMLLTNTHNIREVIFFPTLRSRTEEK